MWCAVKKRLAPKNLLEGRGGQGLSKHICGSRSFNEGWEMGKIIIFYNNK